MTSAAPAVQVVAETDIVLRDGEVSSGNPVDMTASATAAAGAIARQLAAAGTTIEGFHVQVIAPEGPELIVGAVGDPAFGPLVACGAGGAAVELLGDVQVRLAPLGRARPTACSAT